MHPLLPRIAQCTHSQIDQPDVGRARGDQQSAHPHRITQMALVKLEPSALPVGQEGFDVGSRAVERAGRYQVNQVRHQKDWLFICLFPQPQNRHRPRLLRRHKHRPDPQLLADFPAGISVGHEIQHLALARSQSWDDASDGFHFSGLFGLGSAACSHSIIPSRQEKEKMFAEA